MEIASQNSATATAKSCDKPRTGELDQNKQWIAVEETNSKTETMK